MKKIDEILNFIGDFNVSFQGRDVHLIGCLTKRNGNVVLECRATKENAELFHSNDQYQVYGDVAGTYVTLLESSVTSARYIGMDDDCGMLTITPSEIILGRSTKEIVKVRTISSDIMDLNKMLMSEVFKKNYHLTKENPSIVQFAFPKKMTAYDKDGQLTVGRTFRVSNSRDKFEIQIIPYVMFEFHTSVEIHEAMAKLASVRNLFAFFADYYLPMDGFKFADDETPKEYGDDYRDCDLILNYVEDIETPDNPFLVCSNTFESAFQKIWDNWQSFNTDNRHVSTLFFEMISHHSKRTNRFLNLCQCLEVYSNHCRNADAGQVRDAYATNGKRNITLKHRLEDLFLYLNPFLMLREDKCAELATTISNARNFFTHYNEKKYSEPSFDCIAYSCEFLHFVLLLIVYKTVGIPDKYILDCKNQREYKNMNFFVSKIN